MSRILDIGERVELVPMDMHFHDISLAFYQKEKRKGTRYLIHSYSRMEGINDRITFVRDSAKILGGLESREDGSLYFSCESEHLAGAKRIFLEACKIATGDKVHMLPLEIDDKKAGCRILISSGKVAFPCGHAHDALIGLLLKRAPNVRAVLREQEAALTRGVLAAPSQQK